MEFHFPTSRRLLSICSTYYVPLANFLFAFHNIRRLLCSSPPCWDSQFTFLDLLCGVASKIHTQAPNDLYTEPLWNNSSFQDNFSVVNATKTDTLCANAQLSWLVRWVSAYLLDTSPKSFPSWWKTDTLHSVVCPSVYLEWVSVSK